MIEDEDVHNARDQEEDVDVDDKQVRVIQRPLQDRDEYGEDNLNKSLPWKWSSSDLHDILRGWREASLLILLIP